MLTGPDDNNRIDRACVLQIVVVSLHCLVAPAADVTRRRRVRARRLCRIPRGHQPRGNHRGTTPSLPHSSHLPSYIAGICFFDAEGKGKVDKSLGRD